MARGTPFWESFSCMKKHNMYIYYVCMACVFAPTVVVLSESWVSVAESIFFPKVDSHCPRRVKGESFFCRVGNTNLRDKHKT